MKPKPSYAPLYCALYPELAELFRTHGYALAIHGSLQRDFDLIAIPWTKKPSTPKEVIMDITKKFAIKPPIDAVMTSHYRTIYTLPVGWGECFIDLSFMPTQQFLGVKSTDEQQAG